MNIILVHGFLGFSRELGFSYFRGVAAHFRAKGLRVIAPTLDPVGGIAFRGNQLRDQVVAAFGSGDLDPHGATHIIAHSMGGLDSRYILSPANPQRITVPIRSLTTIGTPHQGSPVADVLDDPCQLFPFPHLPFPPDDHALDAILDRLGISCDGLRDLTTAKCREFSRTFVDNPAVAYFSEAGSGRAGFPPTAAALILLHQYVRARTGEPNDGLVALSSARWGVFDQRTWAVDHVEEVGYDLDRLPCATEYPYLARYDEIVARVSALA